MLKKICLIVLGLLIVVGLTSCGGKTVEKSGSEALSLIDVEFKDFECVRNNVTTILKVNWELKIKDSLKDHYKLKEIMNLEYGAYVNENSLGEIRDFNKEKRTLMTIYLGDRNKDKVWCWQDLNIYCYSVPEEDTSFTAIKNWCDSNKEEVKNKLIKFGNPKDGIKDIRLLCDYK